MSKHKPDHEMTIMQRGLRELATLTPAGRDRVIRYWTARVESLPVATTGNEHGEQQLDIEDVEVAMHVAGGTA